METFTQLLETFSSWAVAITAIVAMLSAVCKPFREFIKSKMAKKNDEILEQIKNTETKLDQLSDDISALSKEVDAIKFSVGELDGKHTILKAENESNERDRIKDVIYKFGNIARQHKLITSEEFRHLQDMFAKYKKLGGNGNAEREFNFVTQYYNDNSHKWVSQRSVE